MTRYFFLLFLSFFLFPPPDLNAQRVDFEEFPRLDADYDHLRLELEVTDDLVLRGDAAYELSLLRGNVDTLRLDAIRMDMESIEWNDEPVDYLIDDDRLLIVLPGGTTRSGTHSMRIRYSANPSFGVFRDDRGTIWSSGKPGSVRHWLPVVDHPRNSFTSDVTFIFPTGKEAVFSGVRGDESVESVDLKRVRFHADSDMPASSMRFAIGDFELSQSTSGRHQLTLYTQSGLLDDEKKQNLLETSGNAFSLAERILGTGYPSRGLNLVILADDMWESKNYGAGIVFGFKNQGNLSSQLTYGTLAQWIGIQLREERWEDPDAILLLQTWLAGQSRAPSGEESRPRSGNRIQEEGIYRAFSPAGRADWTRFMNSPESEPFHNLLDQTGSVLLEDLPEVINWYDFTSYLYSRSGLNLMERPEFPAEEPDETEPVPEYRVIYHHDEAENRLRLEFRAVEQAVEELVTVTAREDTFNDSQSREITFTGESDDIVLNVNQNVENLKLSVEGDVKVVLRPEKPLRFWLYQLRRDEDPASRAEAAAGLRNYSDNPDLQLALLDIIDSEEDPEAYAEVVRTLAAVTDGASGTHQLFLPRFDPDGQPEVQIAIIDAFANYPGNDAVIRQLRNVILEAETIGVKEQALASLAVVTESERFLSMSENLLADERGEAIAPYILRRLAGSGLGEAAISLAPAFLDDHHTYANRAGVLDLLLDYDTLEDRWEERIVRLSSDRDPRMRYRILDGLQFLTTGRGNEFVEERLYEEYDDRVIRRLNELRMPAGSFR